MRLIKLNAAETYTVIVLLAFGLGVCLLLPVGGGYDEETHLIRVWEMSALKFIPNEKLGNEMPFPAVYWEMSYRRPFLVRTVEPDFWDKYKGLALNAHDYIYGDVETRSVYAPPLLFPQAMVMRYLGRSLQFPALTVFYVIRIVGLLCYLALAWYSVRIIPFGKWILALLVSSPVAILQASTVSADAISNGIAILFIAGSLAIADKKEIRWQEWIYLALFFLILFWGKLNIVPLAVLPFLLIKPSQFKIQFGYVALFVTAIGLFLIEVAGWGVLAYPRLSTAAGKADPLGQLAFIITKPLQSFAIIARDIWMNAFGRLLDWIAIYGFAYWPIPVWIYYLVVVGLITALFLCKDNNMIDRKTRVVLGIVFIVTYLGTILAMYITQNPVGNDRVNEVQGRYFMTVMPLLFLALACLPTFKRIQIPGFLPAALGITSLVLYIVGMYLSYHVPCGSQYYQPGLCYQPNYKNWAPDEVYSPPISKDLMLAQEIVPECDGMTELRVWMDASGANPTGTTIFTLMDVNRGRKILVNFVPNTELSLKAWYALHFPPEWKSSGTFYLLTIQSDNGPRIAYSIRPEYPAGKLFENDQALGQDIIFQTGCVAGWDKMRMTGSP